MYINYAECILNVLKVYFICWKFTLYAESIFDMQIFKGNQRPSGVCRINLNYEVLMSYINSVLNYSRFYLQG